MKTIVLIAILVAVGFLALCAFAMTVHRCPECGEELHHVGDKWICYRCRKMYDV